MKIDDDKTKKTLMSKYKKMPRKQTESIQSVAVWSATTRVPSCRCALYLKIAEKQTTPDRRRVGRSIRWSNRLGHTTGEAVECLVKLYLICLCNR